MIRGWSAGDTAITRAKKVNQIQCLECDAYIKNNGGRKRCSACSEIHARKLNSEAQKIRHKAKKQLQQQTAEEQHT